MGRTKGEKSETGNPGKRLNKSAEASVEQKSRWLTPGNICKQKGTPVKLRPEKASTSSKKVTSDREGSKKTGKGSKKDTTVVEFVEEGINMHMAVTDQENNEFSEQEVDMDVKFDQVTNSEEDEENVNEQESDEEQENVLRGSNKNAQLSLKEKWCGGPRGGSIHGEICGIYGTERFP